MNEFDDEAAQEAQEQERKKQRLVELDDLKWLVHAGQGRRVVMRLLEQAGVFRTSFNHSGSQMAFNEGRRDIGLWLTAELLEASPDGYFKLLKEFSHK